MIKDRRFALVFRAASLLIAIAGFLDMLGVFGGNFWVGALVYYTMLSNILVITLFAMLTVRTVMGLCEGKKGSAGYFARFEMTCSLNIMLTLLVYWILLAPRLFTMTGEYSLWTFGNLAVHTITPLLCLLDYILFTQPRHLKYRDVYYVCIFPLVYLVGTSLAGLMGYVYMISPTDGLPVRFPYFFYDFDRLGAMSLAYIGALIAFFILTGHVCYIIDRKRSKVSV